MICSAWDDLVRTTVPFCRHQRSTIWAGERGGDAARRFNAGVPEVHAVQGAVGLHPDAGPGAGGEEMLVVTMWG